jgi:Pyruvate/2-oxoacid:ferredoxin oxidoreductase delta subunit
LPEARIVLNHLSEFPYKSIAMATTRSNLTGLWRYWRPYYQTKRSPCDAFCPAGNEVTGFVQAAAKGDWDLAALLLRDENPLPAITGRLCPHPCETHCNRRSFDSAISIQAIERLAADLPTEPASFPLNPNPRSVAILGSGPEELTAAYFLQRLGHQVTLAGLPRQMGGALRELPADRLPQGLLDAELDRLWALGIRTMPAGDASPEEWAATFDAVIPAAGKPGGPATSPEVGQGKRAALLLDAAWRGLDPAAVLERILVSRQRTVSAAKYRELLNGDAPGRVEEMVTYQKLNTDFFEPAARVDLDHGAGLSQAAVEAQRCFSCGLCNSCDKCWMYCPDLCISRQDGHYAMDYDYCKGCSVCAAICPRGVISVIEEKKWKS